jgi:hypothetical protein
VYKGPNFGRSGRKCKKGVSKKRKEISFFLKKRNPKWIWKPSHKSRSVQIICKLKYLLSRGQNAIRHSVPAQKIRGLLKSSPNVGQYFQPCEFVKFPVGQEIAQVGWAVPSDHEVFNGNVISLIVGQTVEWGLALGACYAFVPEPLD